MPPPAMLLNRAQDAHARGQLARAMDLYEQVLASDPRNYAANYYLGIALYQAKKPREAVPFLRAASGIRPGAPEPHKDLGLILLNLGDHAGAEASLSQALTLAPGNPQLLVNRGIALKNLGRAEEAASCQRTALAAQPDFAEAHHHLGGCLLALGRPEEALTSFRRAAELKPALADAQQGAGQALLDLGRTAEAIATLRDAARRSPGAAETHRALAIALLREEKGEEALEAAGRALAIEPAHAGARAAQGAALEQLGRNEEALASYAAAVKAAPRSVDALLGQASALRRLQRFDEALAVCDQAIAADPARGDAYYAAGLAFMHKREFAAALRSFDEAVTRMPDVATLHHQRGEALAELGHFTEAIAAADQALGLDPARVGSYFLKASLLSRMNRTDEALAVLEAARPHDTEKDRGLAQRFDEKRRMCQWEGSEEDAARLLARLDTGEGDLMPFQTLSFVTDAALQRRSAETAAAELEARSLPPRTMSISQRDGRLAIGYVTGDFRDHATMFLMAEIFERHDRSRFRIVGLSLKRQMGSVMRHRVIPFLDAFHDLDDLSDREVIDLARKEEIDIAVDLMGFTRYSRSSLFASGLAPAQVSYLGYPGTTGMRRIDYLIADPVVIPPELRGNYTEKIAYLPDSYQPNDRRRQIAERVFTRAELGLPPDAFVFCCFNNSFKITPEVFASWMRILAQAPHSVLWLLSKTPAVITNLRQAAAGHGIDPQRLVFAEGMELAEHLARHRAADIVLDTLPYNAHTTASDALWAGLPVITLPGETFASRVAASLLTAAGLPEMIASSREDYERMALHFYHDRAALDAVRAKLAANRLSCPLFDSERYTRNLESLYGKIAARSQDGLPPDHVFA